MFHFPGFAFDPYVFRAKYLHEITGNPKPRPRFRGRNLGVPVIEGGFPHSEISGSKPIRGSPKLIAAYHVLHRLLAPRHPPNALKTLDRSHRRCAPLGRGFRSLAGPDLEWDRRLLKRPASHWFDDGCGQHPPVTNNQSQPVVARPIPRKDPQKIEQCPYSQCQIATRFPPGGPASLENAKRKFADKTRAQNHLSSTRQGKWWSQTGSNRRPHACKARALPTELWPQRLHKETSVHGLGEQLLRT